MKGALLLAMVLLSMGCAVTPRAVLGTDLGSLSSGTSAPLPGWNAQDKARPHPQQGAQEDGAELLPRQALFAAVLDVSGATRRISRELSRLKGSQRGIAGRAGGLFVPHVDYGERQLRWIDAELDVSRRLLHSASVAGDPDMRGALLRLSGSRLEAALLGSILLAAWVDFLNLADAVLQSHLFYSSETLLVNLTRTQTRVEPTMTALASLSPEQIEAAAADLPLLMGYLSAEFDATRASVRDAEKRGRQIVAVAQSLEMLTLLSAMKMSLPRLPPMAPTALGVSLVMGADGVMLGRQVVVSTEWVEMMQRLVRAGVVSLPVVAAAVRIQAGQVLLSEVHQELPRGVRDALGDGPEVRGMRVTGRSGAGMTRPPRHHVLPREFREWFEKRGFTGEMSIDQFCIEMEQAHHEAIHGGGNWRLGRQWPGEWNQMIMEALSEAETTAGRMLTRTEVLDLVAYRMKFHQLPMNFTFWRGP